MKKLKRSLIIILLLVLPVAYLLWDMGQAKDMAADACSKAVKGMSLDEYMDTINQENFKIILNDRECILVPKGSMGRYNCVVSLENKVITGCKTSFLD